MVDVSKDARKALIALAIETALLRMGKSVYDQVIDNLYEEYHCYLTDCYKHPEYLKRISHDLFGKSSVTIVESIKEYLGEHTEQKGIDSFIAVTSG